MAHGWAMAAWQVVGARIGLGATEAVQTPLTIKTVATLFPPDKRSFAFGVGTAIAGLGTISMPFFIPVMAATMGWRGALVFGGVAGFVTLALWLWFARGITFDDKAEDEKLDFSDDGVCGRRDRMRVLLLPTDRPDRSCERGSGCSKVPLRCVQRGAGTARAGAARPGKTFLC